MQTETSTRMQNNAKSLHATHATPNNDPTHAQITTPIAPNPHQTRTREQNRQQPHKRPRDISSHLLLFAPPLSTLQSRLQSESQARDLCFSFSTVLDGDEEAETETERSDRGLDITWSGDSVRCPSLSPGPGPTTPPYVHPIRQPRHATAPRAPITDLCAPLRSPGQCRCSHRPL